MLVNQRIQLDGCACPCKGHTRTAYRDSGISHVIGSSLGASHLWPCVYTVMAMAVSYSCLFLGDYTFHGDLVLTNGTHHVRFKQLFSETQCSKLGAVTATCWQVPFARI